MAGERRGLTPQEAERIRAIAKAQASGSFYGVLGVSPDASADAVERAFHGLAREWHPDRFYSRDTGELGPLIEENFVAITRAFHILRDPVKRAGYNRENKIEVKPEAPPTPGTHEVAFNTERARRPPVAAPPPPPPLPKYKATPAVEKIRQQISERLVKAAQYFEAGKSDFQEGKFGRAESALYLAVQFDLQNETYQAMLAKASAKSKELRAKQFISQAEQEESYQRIKEATALYTKAVECDPPDGLAYYRLAMLVRHNDQDDRAALNWLRKAVQKEPNNVAYRIALAEMYEGLGMVTNALREATAASEADPKSDAAKKLLKRLKK